MTKTKRNPHKEEREWQDLIHEKKAYLYRKQQEEEMDFLIRQVKRRGPKEEDDDPSE